MTKNNTINQKDLQEAILKEEREKYRRWLLRFKETGEDGIDSFTRSMGESYKRLFPYGGA